MNLESGCGRMATKKTVLTIAGFDPSGGAGIITDLRAFAAFGCHGTAAITSLTSQNSFRVNAAYNQHADIVLAQIEPILEEFDIAAVKIGMLPTPEIIDVVAKTIEEHTLTNIVLDPVIRSTSGFDLIDLAAAHFLSERLLPLADVITPNIAEAEVLSGAKIRNIDEMKLAAKQLHQATRSYEFGKPTKRAVLVKGGHLEDRAIDVLATDDGLTEFDAEFIRNVNTHGTGCRLSSAIAAGLAQGSILSKAILDAKQYVTDELKSRA